MEAIEIKKDIFWIGALDPNLRIFDIVMYTPYGTTYNSYIVKGSEKTAVFETVKEKFFDQYLERLKSLNINIEDIDYIVVDHTEPDHAGSVARLLELAPKAKVVGSAAAIKFITAIANRKVDSIIVGDGDSLSLGNKTLKFISAPFLHWPDSIYTYIEEDHMLLTCDSFGCHYSTEKIFNNQLENKDNYNDALKYYFDCIMGPFKPYVLKAIDKIKDLKLDLVCPGHGPILVEDIDKIINLYKEWSTPKEPSKNKKVVICYVSAYGYTAELAQKIQEGILSKDGFEVTKFDVIYSKMEDILSSIEDADGILFGSPTINGDALKPIYDILSDLNPIIHGKKAAAAFGSYGWSGEAVKNIEARLEQLKMRIVPGLRINFKPSEEELQSAFKFGENFREFILSGEESYSLNIIDNDSIKRTSNPANTTVKMWKCIICGLIVEGVEPPEICPACGASSDQFVEVTEEEINFKSDKKENFVIIGNGAAGLYAAESIRKRNEVCDIQMISSENHITYYRPLLSDCISSEVSASDFYLKDENWYKENRVKLTLNSTVEQIDTKNKMVILENGDIINFDKLIVANGSNNFMPNITGNTLSGVYTLKYIADAEKIKKALNSAKDVIVVGGGLLGLEAAWEIKKRGINVTVIELQKYLLPMQLDEEGAEFFRSLVEKSGVTLLLGDCIDEIKGDTHVKEVKLLSGKTLRADLILFSIGIRSNKSLAEKSGINTNRGILVNNKMETNITDVYACGDVSEYDGIVYGNWPAAIEMGRVAGINAVGDNTEFKNFVSSVVFNAMNIELFSCGEIIKDSPESLELKSFGDNIYKKLFFKNQRLVGAILIGDTSGSVKIMSAVEKGASVTEALKLI